ncbi:MAG: hypothetical protein ACRC03_08550 [Romboutsia sp.]
MYIQIMESNETKFAVATIQLDLISNSLQKGEIKWNIWKDAMNG